MVICCPPGLSAGLLGAARPAVNWPGLMTTPCLFPRIILVSLPLGGYLSVTETLGLFSFVVTEYEIKLCLYLQQVGKHGMK